MPKAQPANLNAFVAVTSPRNLSEERGELACRPQVFFELLPVSQMLSFATAKELEVANLH